MDSDLEHKFYSALSPATNVDNICLDLYDDKFFSDFYDQKNKILGAGAFGIVVLASDKNTQKDLAIKILNISRYGLPHHSNGGRQSSISLDTKIVISFLKNEIDLSKDLSDANIIKVHQVKYTL